MSSIKFIGIIIQVSDRFHLIKGLSESVRDEIKKILSRQIIINEVKVDISKKVLGKGMKKQRMI